MKNNCQEKFSHVIWTY